MQKHKCIANLYDIVYHVVYQCISISTSMTYILLLVYILGVIGHFMVVVCSNGSVPEPFLTRK